MVIILQIILNKLWSYLGNLFQINHGAITSWKISRSLMERIVCMTYNTYYVFFFRGVVTSQLVLADRYSLNSMLMREGRHSIWCCQSALAEHSTPRHYTWHCWTSNTAVDDIAEHSTSLIQSIYRTSILHCNANTQCTV